CGACGNNRTNRGGFQFAAARLPWFIPMRKSMREDGMDADVVLLAGGGAEAYQDAAKELFPKSRIVLPNESVASNARGFWFCG
ncbi:hypothetical protein NA471_23350, partial [Salmonella sp. NW547]